MDLKSQIQEAANFIKSKIKISPEVAIVLGSGLGPFAKEVQGAIELPYKSIPHFKEPSVVGHEGKLVIGTIKGTPVIVQQGRWHYYEGHSMDEVAIPVRTFAALGVKTIILTNAAGGVNLKFKVSDLMVITDHINLMANNPLKGHSAKIFGTQFPDMSDKALRTLVLKLGKNLKLKQGVYAALSGPNYETPAEIRMLRTLGVDAIGMSTVPEAIAARHLGMKVIGISCITNMAAGVTNKKLHHDEVKEAANNSMKKFVKLLKSVVENL